MPVLSGFSSLIWFRVRIGVLMYRVRLLGVGEFSAS